MHVFRFREFGLKTPIHAKNWGFWPPKCGAMWTNPKKEHPCVSPRSLSHHCEHPSPGLTFRWVPKKGQNFFDDRLRGVDFVGGGIENCPFPLTKLVAVNTAGATAQPVMCVTFPFYFDYIISCIFGLIHWRTTAWWWWCYCKLLITCTVVLRNALMRFACQ